ncbi:MFS transporter [Nonomuraea ferruginea]
MLAACMIGFFSAPASLDGIGLLLWFAVFAILCEAFDSMLNANYGALLPELYPRERDRAVANGLRQGFQLVALVISLAVTPLLTTQVFGTEETTQGFQTTAIIYGVIALVVIVFMALGARENPRYSTRERPPLLRSVWSIVRNRMFWTVGLTGACYGIAMALVLSGIQLYVRYSLGLPVGNALYLQGIVILVSAAWPRGVDARRRAPRRPVGLAGRLRGPRGQLRRPVPRHRPGHRDRRGGCWSGPGGRGCSRRTTSSWRGCWTPTRRATVNTAKGSSCRRSASSA